MSTQSKFFIYLGGRHIGASSSLGKANKKLTKAVLNRAMKGNGSAVTGQIKNSVGTILQTREFGEAIYGGAGGEV